MVPYVLLFIMMLLNHSLRGISMTPPYALAVVTFIHLCLKHMTLDER